MNIPILNDDQEKMITVEIKNWHKNMRFPIHPFICVLFNPSDRNQTDCKWTLEGIETAINRP